MHPPPHEKKKKLQIAGFTPVLGEKNIPLFELKDSVGNFIFFYFVKVFLLMLNQFHALKLVSD